MDFKSLWYCGQISILSGLHHGPSFFGAEGHSRTRKASSTLWGYRTSWLSHASMSGKYYLKLLNAVSSSTTLLISLEIKFDCCCRFFLSGSHIPSAAGWCLCLLVCLQTPDQSCPSWSASPRTPESPRYLWNKLDTQARCSRCGMSQ